MPTRSVNLVDRDDYLPNEDPLNALQEKHGFNDNAEFAMDNVHSERPTVLTTKGKRHGRVHR